VAVEEPRLGECNPGFVSLEGWLGGKRIGINPQHGAGVGGPRFEYA
jgi:hypothetical protein